MKALFLDVDGVLNYAGWAERHGLVPVPAPYKPTVEQLVAWIDPAKMELVNEIVRRTDCEVILSSSTRSDPRMGLVLVKAGLCKPILDSTPILQWEVDAKGNITGVKTRADEVAASVLKWNPNVFVVLDDQDDHEWERLAVRIAGRLTPGQIKAIVDLFFVKTEFETGLGRNHVELAVTLLNRRDP